MTNRERAEKVVSQYAERVGAVFHPAIWERAITRALDEATAEAHADAAATRKYLRGLMEQAELNRCFDCTGIAGAHDEACGLAAAAAPHPGAPLLAELEAAREIVMHYAGHDPDCDGVDHCLCGFLAATEKYNAARGAR